MRMNASEFIRTALLAEIAVMLDELGNPELINRIYPTGWRNLDILKLTQLFDLCHRTFVKRERDREIQGSE